MFGLLEFSLRNTVVYNTGTDPDISGVVSYLQASYCNTTVELAINCQVADSTAVITALGFFQLADYLHSLNLRCSRECAHIHSRKVRAQRIKLIRERALDITNQMLDGFVFFSYQQLCYDSAARLSNAGDVTLNATAAVTP